MRDLLIIIFFLTILSCTRTSDSNLTNSDNVDTLSTVDNAALDSLDFNIVKYDTSYYYIFPKTFVSTDLSDKEIVACENLLRLFIENYNVEAKKRFDEMTKQYPNVKFNVRDYTIELEDYGRQYMSVVSDKGEKMVYVNCFCDPKEFEYRDKELVQVHDGGNCFFNFRVDLKNKTIFDFMENGVA
jgi:c-di-AMP phosphodiesterase-like protein